MKNVLKFLSLFLVVSFFFVACEDDDPCEDVTCSSGEICDNGDCIQDPAVCEACGNYEGDVNSDGDSVTFLIGTLGGLDNEVMTDQQFVADVSENSNSSDSLDMVVTLSIDVPVGSSTVPADIPIDITVFYDASNNTFAAGNIEKVIAVNAGGAINVDVAARVEDFSGTVDGTNVDGSITLSDGTSTDPDVTNATTDATLKFSGTKQ